MANSREGIGRARTKTKSWRKNVLWVTPDYDDEVILRYLRSNHPAAKWEEIQRMFNRCVPKPRHRTLNAIYSKAKLICSAYKPLDNPTAGSVLDSAAVSHGEVGQTVCSPLHPLLLYLLMTKQGYNSVDIVRSFWLVTGGFCAERGLPLCICG